MLSNATSLFRPALAAVLVITGSSLCQKESTGDENVQKLIYDIRNGSIQDGLQISLTGYVNMKFAGSNLLLQFPSDDNAKNERPPPNECLQIIPRPGLSLGGSGFYKIEGSIRNIDVENLQELYPHFYMYNGSGFSPYCLNSGYYIVAEKVERELR